MADHIQIGDISPRIQYIGDGTQTLFAYPFPIFAAVDLEVYVGDAMLATGYAVSGAGEDGGGSVTFDTPPVSGATVTLRRRLSIARQSDFQESGAFRAKVINDELDFLTAALQQVSDDARRSVQLAPTDPDVVLTLPAKEVRGGCFLAFDAEGRPIATEGSADGLAVSGFIALLLDDTDAASARATLAAQEDLAVAPPTTGDAGAVLCVDGAGGLQYDPTLAHGAYLTALHFGL